MDRQSSDTIGSGLDHIPNTNPDLGDHGLINYIRQLLIRVYRLEIQPDMLYFRPSFVKRCPFF